jgi:hypothetical protein
MRDPGAARVVTQNEHFLVIDDALSPRERDLVWNHLQAQPFKRVEELGFQGHWLLEDAAALRGPSVGWASKLDAKFPTDTPIDVVMARLVDFAAAIEPVLGARGAAWEDFTAQASLYPAGTGLHWHRDAPENAGSYTYYAHPEWNAEWGGELLLLDDRSIPEELGVYFHALRPTAEEPRAAAWPSHLDNDDASRLLLERGLGWFVAPKPNRLVVIRSGTPHTVAKVRAAAGRHVRASISGFVKRKAR